MNEQQVSFFLLNISYLGECVNLLFWQVVGIGLVCMQAWLMTEIYKSEPTIRMCAYFRVCASLF